MQWHALSYGKFDKSIFQTFNTPLLYLSFQLTNPSPHEFHPLPSRPFSPSTEGKSGEPQKNCALS